MRNARDIDLKAAINAISDVIQNRPRPLRELDQIYMKAGDMVLQSEWVANWADNKRLAFIGDGDAISVSVAYLKQSGILSYGPSSIEVFDFDERMCNAVMRFADKESIQSLSATLYNCIDAFPRVGEFDCFYTNPPWGSNNEGASVNVFVQRGMEAVCDTGEGVVVIADDSNLLWSQQVLASTQLFALNRGFYIQKMQSQMHSYHLEDNPELHSCNLLLKALPTNIPTTISEPITDPIRLNNFYGQGKHARIQYVREKARIDYGKANDEEYRYELLHGGKND